MRPVIDDREAAELCLRAADMPADLAERFLRRLCAGNDSLQLATQTLIRELSRSRRLGSPAGSDLGDVNCSALADILCSFHLAAVPREQPELAAFIQNTDESFYQRALTELVKLDQKLRWSRAQPKPLEVYLGEWSAIPLRAHLISELIRSECLCRAVFADAPTTRELELRFHDLAAGVDLAWIEYAAPALGRALRGGGTIDDLQLPERFNVIRRIGKGGMGVVYEATDRERGTRIALKTLPKMEPLALYRFKREFRTLAGLAHPNLVSLYELISDGNIWFFTMEFVDGVNFISHLRPAEELAADLPTTSNPLGLTGPPADTAVNASTRVLTLDVPGIRAAVHQLAEGVLKLHGEHIVHRDLKPSNVLVRPDGQVVILDFGLAKEITTSEPVRDIDHRPRWSDDPDILMTWTKDDNIVGSVPYMSPEQARGRRVSEASDWYSVGVMLYEALTGQVPFVGSSRQILVAKLSSDPIPPKNLSRDVPDDLNDLCLALLRQDPSLRPSGHEVVERVWRGHGPSAVAIPGRSDAFVGRQGELAILSNAYGELKHRRAVTVHIRGRSGAGKTALAQQFVSTLRGDVIVLSGRCYEQESVPYKALDSIVDELCRCLMVLPHHEIESMIPGDIAALARIFPVLQRVDAIRDASRGRPEIPDVHELRRRGFDALRDLLSRLSRLARLVMVIDDLQWGDVDSAALLVSFLDAAEPPRMLLVALYRSEYAETNPCLVALNAARQRQTSFEVEVAPLPYQESLQLATMLLRAEAANTEGAERIAYESGGNPYFVYELSRQLPLLIQDGAESASRSLDLDEVLWRRVLTLPASARHLLETIAIAGRPLPLRSACEAASLGALASSSVTTLRAEHLVRITGPGFDDEVETYHDRIRESVWSHLSIDVAREHHRRLAIVLEAARNPDIEATASHFHRAGMLDKARLHYAAAGDRAAAALAFERSAELYGLALEVGGSSPESDRQLRRKRADALANGGRGYEAGREYQRVAEGADRREALDLQCRAGYQYCVSGHIDEGRAAFETVLARYGMKLPRTRRKALLSLLIQRLALRLRGMQFRSRPEAQVPREQLEQVDVFWSVATAMTIADPIRGAEFQTRDLMLALRAGEPYRIARALAWESAHISMTGLRLKTRADAQLAAADGLAAQLSVPHATGMIRMSRGVAAYFHGDFASCRRFCEEAAEIFRSQCTGASWELETCNAFALWTFYFRGEYAELARRFATLIAEVRARGARLAEVDLTNFGGPFVWLAADDPQGARRAVAGVMGEWSRQDFQVQHFMTLTAETQIDLYSGDAGAAWRRVAADWAGLADAMLLHVEIVRIYMLHLRARCALAAARSAPDREALLRVARRDARRLSRERAPYGRALANPIKGALAFQRGDTAAAIALLDSAAVELEALGWGCFAAAARRQHGELLGGAAGGQIIRQIDDRLIAEGVKRPDRLCDVQMPGFAR